MYKITAVSYTHLDVYKRQLGNSTGALVSGADKLNSGAGQLASGSATLKDGLKAVSYTHLEAVDARKYGYGGWSVGLIFSIISLIFGIICVTNAFDVMKTATEIGRAHV